MRFTSQKQFYMVNCRDIHDIQGPLRRFLLAPYNRYDAGYEVTHRRATRVGDASINEIRSTSDEAM